MEDVANEDGGHDWGLVYEAADEEVEGGADEDLGDDLDAGLDGAVELDFLEASDGQY